MSNRFGNIFTLTTFGESHGPAIGGIIDGCPAGIELKTDAIQAFLDRRRPGESKLTTPRNEADKVNFLSGIHNGYTTGTPIGFIIENTNVRSQDYDDMERVFRPGHADYTYYKKYNGFNDIRGGGRSSARETACRVVGGAVAQQVAGRLCPGITVSAFTKSIGEISLDTPPELLDLSMTETNPVRCPDMTKAREMENLILKAREDRDTLGGIVTCLVRGCPAGIGEPVFDKLNACLAHAMLSINAAKGFEIGAGFAGTQKRGSELVDSWVTHEDKSTPYTATNHSGGVQGGLSNGMDIVFNVAFKPIATLMQPVNTIDKNGNAVSFCAKGRHDVCVVPRAVPVVEAMTWMVLLDLIMTDRARKF